MMIPEAEEAPPRRTPPPVRLVCLSADKACQIAMLVEWSDELGERHSWSSWDDALCGFYKARKLLPASSSDIRVSFEARPAKRRLRSVDRHKKCAWSKDGSEEVIWLRRGGERYSVDATFEIRGGVVQGAYVARAWNALNDGRPEDWEHWPSFKFREEPPYPTTLLAADVASPCPEPDEIQAPVLQVEAAMARLRAAAQALRVVREQTLAMLREQDAMLTKQWVGVNSTRTVAAGLAVGSVATVATAGVGAIVLGAGSMAAGVGALASDSAGDKVHGSRFARTVTADLYEQLGFESVEAELRTALRGATPPSRKQRRLQAKSPMFVLGAQGAEMLMVEGVRMGIRAGRIASMSSVGQGFSVAGRLLGGVGAGLAVGVAIHGWSTSKPNQKMVREKLAEVERSIEYLSSLERQAETVLCCAICHENLHFTAFAGQLRRCQYFHCFHRECLRGRVEVHPQWGTLCPECPKDLPGAYLGEMDSPGDRLRALLWRSGLREQVSLSVESLAPTVLTHARDLLSKLRSGESRPSPRERPERGQSQSPPRHRWGCCFEEDADTYEAWREAAEGAGSVAALARAPFAADAEPESLALLETLLVQGTGVPVKFRLVCWPIWLAVPERQVRAEAAGRSYRCLAEADHSELPEAVAMCIDADVPRTRDDLPDIQREALRHVLLAFAHYCPEIGYAQGLNHLAGVFLKLGFEEEIAFWMLVALLEDLVPGCHAPDLQGLYRDTAVSDALLETFLPSHLPALAACDCDLLWMATDYFLTIGTKDMTFAVVLRLWDFCFLHGCRALFAGFLAHLEMCLPIMDADDEDREDNEAVMEAYVASSRALDASKFAERLQSFMHHRQGGISEELVAALRETLADGFGPPSSSASVGASGASFTPPPRSPAPRSPLVAWAAARSPTQAGAVSPKSCGAGDERFMMPPG